MFKITRGLLLSLLSTGFVPSAQSSDDVFQFFAEEAQVTSASRIPMARKEAPATVYVVTSQDIKDSGAQTIWDALRGVPGVDVMQTRTNQGELSIRGLNKPLNNRTLILVNGRTELNTFFDFVTWESIPFTMQEIDRIEVVEGPASAVYGANAVNGVINIITKTPEQFQGGQASFVAGDYNTHIADYDYGRKLDKWAYRFGIGYRAMDRFENSDNLASRSGKFNVSTEYAPDADSKLSVSGGLTRLNTEVTSGSAGTFFNKGSEGFFETVYRNRGTKYRAYWNRYRTKLKNFTALNEGNLNSDIYYGEVEQSFSLPFGNEALIGGDVQRNSSRSTVLSKAQIQQLWALYLEDKWEISDRWSMLASGRLDGHPYTARTFSPRASLIFSPAQEHVFRLSAGTAFRNPTLLENNINTVLETPLNDPLLPFFTSVRTTTLGNRNLVSERIKTAELAHTGQFGRLTTRLAGFYYKLRKIIMSGPSETTGLVPPTMTMLTSYINSGSIEAWGGEFGLNMRLGSWASSYANYSYQRIKDLPGPRITSRQSPLNKVNAGLRAKHGGWTGDLQAGWVDRTYWIIGLNTTDMLPVKAYYLVNAHVGYGFKGRLTGLEAGISAFNLLNNSHYEVLPRISAAQPGQLGEIMHSRWTGTVSYRF